MPEGIITGELEKRLDGHLKEARELLSGIKNPGKIAYNLGLGGLFHVRIGDFTHSYIDMCYSYTELGYAPDSFHQLVSAIGKYFQKIGVPVVRTDNLMKSPEIRDEIDSDFKGDYSARLIHNEPKNLPESISEVARRYNSPKPF